jgi:hypothetical protein
MESSSSAPVIFFQPHCDVHVQNQQKTDQCTHQAIEPHCVVNWGQCSSFTTLVTSVVFSSLRPVQNLLHNCITSILKCDNWLRKLGFCSLKTIRILLLVKLCLSHYNRFIQITVGLCFYACLPLYKPPPPCCCSVVIPTACVPSDLQGRGKT